MATVIRTGGQTIRISNGTSGARRAAESTDPISAAMEAGEAFARSEIACEAFGAMVNRAAQMSMEGKASMWKRVKAAGSRTWEAIKAFFRKMIAYVTSFISGNVIMLKAKRLKKRIEDGDVDDNINDNWDSDKKTVKMPLPKRSVFESAMNTLKTNYIAKTKEALTLTSKDFKKTAKNMAGKNGDAWGNVSALSYDKDGKETKIEGADAVGNLKWSTGMSEGESVTGKDYWGGEATGATAVMRKTLDQYTSGAVKALVFLKADVIPSMNKMYKAAEKYAKEAADNNKVAAFRAAQQITKRTVSIIIKQVQGELSLIAKVISEPAD